MKKIGIFLVLISTGFFANADTPKVVATQDVQPEYPASALRRDKTGYVTVRFDINENGKASNINVVEAVPDSSFNSAALTALKRSSFELLESDKQTATNVERVYRFETEEKAQTTPTLSMN